MKRKKMATCNKLLNKRSQKFFLKCSIIPYLPIPVVYNILVTVAYLSNPFVNDLHNYSTNADCQKPVVPKIVYIGRTRHLLKLITVCGFNSMIHAAR